MLHQQAVEPHTLAILKTICSRQEFNSFALGGGTSIALRKGHRFSIDLDFFANKNFDTQQLYKNLLSIYPNAELLFEQNQTMIFLVNGVKVDFVLYPFDWVQPHEEIESVRLISLQDIIPMKLQAISNRFSKKDFWDIESLLQDYSLEKMINIFKQKFPPIDTGFIVQSLTNFYPAEKESDPVCIIPKSWEIVKENITEAVKSYTERFL